MERQENYCESDSSQVTFDKENSDRITYIRSMLETQQKQVKILHQGLLDTSQENHPGTVSKIRRLQPTIFNGTEKPLDAEQ